MSSVPEPRHLLNPTTRFSGRAAAYQRSRPGLPAPIIDAILSGFDRSRTTIADLGAGTGLASLALADALTGKSHVLAIEPNLDMAALAPAHPRIQWLQGARAEQTGLPDASIDIAVAVTSFHWFDPVHAPREITRILRLRGRLAVLATDRDPADPVAAEFHRLIGESDRAITPSSIHDWYGPAFLPGAYSNIRVVSHDQPQRFDLDRLLARAESSSYWHSSEAAQRTAREGITQLWKHHADGDGALTVPYHTVGLIAERDRGAPDGSPE